MGSRKKCLSLQRNCSKLKRLWHWRVRTEMMRLKECWLRQRVIFPKWFLCCFNRCDISNTRIKNIIKVICVDFLYSFCLFACFRNCNQQIVMIVCFVLSFFFFFFFSQKKKKKKKKKKK